MLDRRRLLLGGGVAVIGTALPAAARAEGEATIGDDGLFSEPWFLQSFLELADDLETATSAGKRFAIMWELKGCPYCRETHLVNFADPAIRDYVKDNFDVLQLNLIGSRIVTDFDGEQLAERDFARKYGIRPTPAFQFFPETADGLAKIEPAKREVMRAAGYLEKPMFLALFQYVRNNAYAEQSFRNYLKTLKS